MKRLAIGTLGSIQKLPGLVRNFFSQPECQYIAMRLYLTKKLVRKNIRFIVDESYIGSFSNYPEWMVCRYRLESLMFFKACRTAGTTHALAIYRPLLPGQWSFDITTKKGLSCKPNL